MEFNSFLPPSYPRNKFCFKDISVSEAPRPSRGKFISGKNALRIFRKNLFTKMRNAFLRSETFGKCATHFTGAKVRHPPYLFLTQMSQARSPKNFSIIGELNYKEMPSLNAVFFWNKWNCLSYCNRS